MQMARVLVHPDIKLPAPYPAGNSKQLINYQRFKQCPKRFVGVFDSNFFAGSSFSLTTAARLVGRVCRPQ
jgi:hypothetical protein